MAAPRAFFGNQSIRNAFEFGILLHFKGIFDCTKEHICGEMDFIETLLRDKINQV